MVLVFCKHCNIAHRVVVSYYPFFPKMQVHNVREKKEEQPTHMNAFELISLSKGLNLENLFDIDQVFNLCEIGLFLLL